MSELIRTPEWRTYQPENRLEFEELVLGVARKSKYSGCVKGLFEILKGRVEFLATNLVFNGYDEDGAYADGWNNTWEQLIGAMESAAYDSPAEVVVALFFNNEEAVFVESNMDRPAVLAEGQYSLYRILGPRFPVD